MRSIEKKCYKKIKQGRKKRKNIDFDQTSKQWRRQHCWSYCYDHHLNSHGNSWHSSGHLAWRCCDRLQDHRCKKNKRNHQKVARLLTPWFCRSKARRQTPPPSYPPPPLRGCCAPRPKSAAASSASSCSVVKCRLGRQLIHVQVRGVATMQAQRSDLLMKPLDPRAETPRAKPPTPGSWYPMSLMYK